MTLTGRPDGVATDYLRGRAPTYDKAPYVAVGTADECAVGWDAVAGRIGRTGARVVAVDCYPGVRDSDVAELVTRLAPDLVVRAEEALLPPDQVERLLAHELTDDPVFGRLSSLSLADLFDAGRLAELRRSVADTDGRVLAVGVGAALVAPDAQLVVHADLPRREATLRQREPGWRNLGVTNDHERPGLKYKRAFFVDWRLADEHKRALWPRVDLVLDTTTDVPKLVAAEAMFRGLRAAAAQPFRVVPWFEPAPWGGHWMTEVCDLPRDEVNHGWCFDCVPEENSLLLGFGEHRFELPSANLVFREPGALLGADVARRFDGEFPIRFDFLDTMGGGNLSLQVHPLTSYIREHFGLTFTQDESYYLLDAEPHATVYLGLRTGVDRAAMAADLRAAQEGAGHFPAERYVNTWPARKHDHFLIPAGTVHCSGAGSMVLEISATPYIFTFKLWDWDRLGLDGRPRPVHLDHGLANIQWQRDTEYAQDKLINRITPLGSGPGWRAERTGLHEAEFIDTHRHWSTGVTPHDTGGGVNVLNLVEGAAAVVESPDGAFEPYVVHYAETFIVPAAVGPYTVRPYDLARDAEIATVKAFVRPTPG